MLKKLVVGALATGIMLSSAGVVMAATPNTESPKQEKVAKAAQLVWLVREYPSRESIPNTLTVDGIKYYLKDAGQLTSDKWTAYFEGWSY
ncbi:LCI family antimicrobial peptide [Bacillus cereus group sp. TH152-1LC]|uniref:LCI family antimicrobial peptide n=1 Tax=Bacillus cereus group sp. TH152-1LC TaxID=3018060 RepID=UPI0022E734CC|nr:LCI family antimicrobial peptide [Bacillus cereus group sp. TH152-1LC]MDA1675329.1 LCI family antimicrobial peptide [Bacillus cereus group sp. TH152-1LC]